MKATHQISPGDGVTGESRSFSNKCLEVSLTTLHFFICKIPVFPCILVLHTRFMGMSTRVIAILPTCIEESDSQRAFKNNEGFVKKFPLT